MSDKKVTIGIVAPGSPLEGDTAERVITMAKERFGEAAPEIKVHPQCFLVDGHFAGTDAERSAAFLQMANDPAINAVWFARGGYGSCRLEDALFVKLNDAARVKTYLGYSDMGSLMGRLYKEDVGKIVHGPLVNDINREGGDAAIARALDYLVKRDPSTLEANINSGDKYAAFNMTILAHLIGTDWAPDLEDHILMLEDVAEYHYRIDRAMFSISSNENIRGVKGVMLGRCTEIPENDRPFGVDEEEIVQHWCHKNQIAYLGRADIGHDADNKIVPFGTAL